jgi:hypothetical protein
LTSPTWASIIRTVSFDQLTRKPLRGHFGRDGHNLVERRIAMTEVSVGDVFPALAAQAERLNKLSDEANKKLAEVEKNLVGLNLGIEFWYSQPIHRDDAVGTFSRDDTSEKLVQVLGFARVDDKWCLAVKPIKLVDGFFEGDTSAPFQNRYSGGKVVALLQASRDMRLASLSHMPEFLKEFSEYVQKASDIIEKVIT